MPSTAISAQGSKIEIDTSANATPVWTIVGNVTSFSGFDGEASDIDVTDLSSIAKEFRAGLVDNGKFGFELNVNRADPGQVALEAARVAGTLKKLRLTLPDTKTATFQVLVKSTPMSGAVDGVLKGSVSTRISGAIAWA